MVATHVFFFLLMIAYSGICNLTVASIVISAQLNEVVPLLLAVVYLFIVPLGVPFVIYNLIERQHESFSSAMRERKKSAPVSMWLHEPSGRYYFVNTRMGTTKWIMPPGFYFSPDQKGAPNQPHACRQHCRQHLSINLFTSLSDFQVPTAPFKLGCNRC